MRCAIITTLTILTLTGLGLADEPAGGASAATPAPATAIAPAPQVEVAFVLDTTGSMSGLIAGAKAKIWYIANQIVLGQPRPQVKMALVAYRDKGDQYVTKVFALTDNIDQVYDDLMSFAADGGGDGPENVNQALHDAVHKLQWSPDKKTLKIIYLVGDSPPHNEYEDVPTYDKTAKAAIEKGIYINTVLCGGNTETGRIWKEIADRSEGRFMAIEQDGGVAYVPTPFDTPLAELNAKLIDTAVVYGDKEVQARQAGLNVMAASAPAPAAAERAAFSLNVGGKASSNDLLDEIKHNRADADKLDESKLPENMKPMTDEQRKQYLADQQARRDGLLKQIGELTQKREEFIKQAQAKTDKPAGFDAEVVKSLQTQAGKHGINYK